MTKRRGRDVFHGRPASIRHDRFHVTVVEMLMTTGANRICFSSGCSRSRLLGCHAHNDGREKKNGDYAGKFSDIGHLRDVECRGRSFRPLRATNTEPEQMLLQILANCNAMTVTEDERKCPAERHSVRDVPETRLK